MGRERKDVGREGDSDGREIERGRRREGELVRDWGQGGRQKENERLREKDKP